MIKIVPKWMRYCMEHYLDNTKVVSIRDKQYCIAVGEGENNL